MIVPTPSRQASLLAELPKPSSTYKRQVWLAVGGLIGFITLYFVLAGWFAYTAYRLTLGADSVAVEGWFIATCSLFLAVMMLKPLFFVKHGGTRGSVEITEEQQPRLFQFLHMLADTAEAPRPHRVFIAPHVNAAVFYDLSALNLIFPSKKNLEIGLGLVNVLTLGELRAVIAHEFGHFSQSSMAVMRWSYLAQQIAAHLVTRRDKLDEFLVRLSHWDVRVAWIGWLVSLIVWSIRSLVDSAFGLVVLLQRALSREMEFQADLVAVSLSGSDALIHALHRLRAADDSWDRTLSVVSDEHARDRIPRDVFTLHSRVITRMGEILSDPEYGHVPPVPAEGAAEHRLFKPELAEPPKMWLTHPLNHDREENTKRNYVPASIDERSAWVLFQDADTLREQVTAAMIGEDAKSPVPIEDSMEAVETYFGREFFDSRYRGVYLGRSVVRAASRAADLVDPSPSNWRQQLDQLYPEALVRDVERLRAYQKELAQLRAIRAGVLAPAEGGIRHRGRIIKPAELPKAIERVERDTAGIEKRLAESDRVHRSVHLAAARELGSGWAEYHQGLLAALHYADHSSANLQDLRGVLAHTLHVATVTRRISDSGRKRVVAAANSLHEAMSAVFAQAGEVTLDTSLAQRLGNTSWADILGKFDLPPAAEENIGDWLDVIDGWLSQAMGPLHALDGAALEQLLITETTIASHARAGTTPEPAPEPSRVPAKYATLLTGKERELTDRLNWWERFQVADGKIATAARVAAAASIVAAVLGFGGTMGSSTITVYNGLSVAVTVDVGGRMTTLPPLTTETMEFAQAGVYPVTARARGGRLIEQFQAELAGSFGNFVYNIGGAAPLIEWTAVYGNAKGVPDKMLGAPRWTRTAAQVLFKDPPDTVETKGGGALRRVLSAATDAPPLRQLALLSDSAEQQHLVETHARWDATTSRRILTWLALAPDFSPNFRTIVQARLAESPNDVILLRAEQDAVEGAEKESICERHRGLADASPENGDFYYLAARCLDDEVAKDKAFADGFAYWPEHPWLAYATGYSRAQRGEWEQALAALEIPRQKLPAVTEHLALDLARIQRLVGSTDNGRLSALANLSPQLAYFLSLETGKGLEQSPDSAYVALSKGELDKAVAIARADSTVQANVLRLAAASDGASPELQARAIALGPELGLDNDTRWASIGMAVRDGRDHLPFMPSAERMDPADAERFLRFVERVRASDVAAAEREIEGFAPLMRGHAYSVAVIVLGDRAPEPWRRGAKQLLFPLERPWFR